MPSSLRTPFLRMSFATAATTTESESPPSSPNLHTLSLKNPPSLPSLDLSSDDQMRVFVEPASPALSSPASFASATSSPTPLPSASFLPPPLSGLAARRHKNKKQLSLIVPATSVPASLVSPSSPSGLHPDDVANAGTRSLPPSPVSLTAFIGVEGSEVQDRLIGRLMLKAQADEMREQMKGGRGMKRRTSIPSLNLGAVSHRPTPLSLGSTNGGTNGGSAVQMIRRDAVERSDLEGEQRTTVNVEEYPYQLGPREILPGIWLGSEQNARDPKVLKEWGIGWILNVAKEVECPWVDEVIQEEEEIEESGESFGSSPPDSRTSPLLSNGPALAPSAATKAKHRRTKTHALIAILPPINPRAPFLRPHASTPNLQSAFKTFFDSPPLSTQPETFAFDLPEQEQHDAHVNVETRSDIGKSPSQQQIPPRARRPTPLTTSLSNPRIPPTSSRYPANSRSGRPSLEYLWLKWGHDESDLVEALKFQVAFDFLDKVRAEGGRVLVHCQCGVSRSATVIIAYCMREAAVALEEGRESSELKGITGMHEAYSFVKEKSEWVGPNLCLVFQLVAYERTLSGQPPQQDGDEEPPYPHYAMTGVDEESPPEPSSPRTPVSNGDSETSSDSQLGDVQFLKPPPSPSSFSMLSGSTLPTPPHSLLGKRPAEIIVESVEDASEALSPMAQSLSLDDHTDKPLDTASATNSDVFIFTMPQRLHDLSPLPSNVTAPPPTPFQEVASPAPSRLSFHSQSSRSSGPRTPAVSRFAFPGPPKATVVTSTPTAAAFSIGETPTAAQFSLARGMSRTPQSAFVEGDEGGRKMFGGRQTPNERRASHKRVFSSDLLPGLFMWT